jgi:polyvinyl alcohol dehydrogenase (cytochrome)
MSGRSTPNDRAVTGRHSKAFYGNALTIGALAMVMVACGGSSSQGTDNPGENASSSGGGSGSGGSSGSGSGSSGAGSSGSNEGGAGSSSGSSGGDAGSGADGGTTGTVGALNCGADSNDWPMHGHNICGTAAPTANSAITTATAPKLAMKWVYTAAGDVSATPAVVGGVVYVPDWGGNIARLDAATGAVAWSKSVASLVPASSSGLGGFVSRTTPLVTSNAVILGTIRTGNPLLSNMGPGAFVIAIDPTSAAVKWATPVHDGHPAAVETGSPVYDGTNLYVGVASWEEAFSAYASGYKCCTFRGSVLAINASTGAIVWRTRTIADGLTGYAGGAVWSTPTIDLKRKLLYVTTGNNYLVPAGSSGSVKGNNIDSILALNLADGTIKWAVSVPENGSDVWTFANSGGPDSDFGCEPNLFTAVVDGKTTDLVGAGQKSGNYYAINPDTGVVVWKTQVGPTGHLGGIHQGTAIDGTRIYVGVNNFGGDPWPLGGKGPQGGTLTSVGAWGALDPATGSILWQVANPAMTTELNGASVNGPITVVNGVMFVGSMDMDGTMYALDATDGKVLWSFQSGATVYGGAAVSGDSVYWGAGYPGGSRDLGFGTTVKKLFAFKVP